MHLARWLAVAGVVVLALGAVSGQGAAEKYDGRTIAEWAKLLGSKDVSSRQDAATALVRAKGAAVGAVKELTTALDDEDDRVRGLAMQAIGNVGSAAAEAVPKLAQIVRTSSRLPARRATLALSRVGRDALGALTELLQDKQPAVRSLGATGMALMGEQASKAAPALAKALLADESYRVRRSCAEALLFVSPKSAEVLGPFLECLQKDNDPDVCRLCAIALGKLGKDALPTVTKALSDPSPSVRYHAAMAMNELGTVAAGSLKSLLPLLHDKDSDVCAMATLALSSGGEEAVPLLVGSLTDKDPEARRLAALGLGQVGKPAKKALPALVKAMGDENKDVRLAAATALGMLEVPAAVEPLTKGLQASETDIREVCAKGIGMLREEGKSAVVPLSALLGDNERAVRLAAAVALMRIGKSSVPQLAETLGKHKSPEARTLSAVVLGEISEHAASAIKPLTEALKDKDENVRMYSARTLGRIGAPAKEALKSLEALIKDSSPAVAAEAQEAIGRIAPSKSEK